MAEPTNYQERWSLTDVQVSDMFDEALMRHKSALKSLKLPQPSKERAALVRELEVTTAALEVARATWATWKGIHG